MTTVLQKWGNSQGIRIPKVLLDDLQWAADEEVCLRVKDDRLIIEKAQTRKTIQELFEGFDGDYPSEKIDWGDPVGEELW